MKHKPILRNFLSVIPMLGMSFLFSLSATHVSNTYDIASRKDAYTGNDFSGETAITADDELTVSIVSSTITDTSHSFNITFRTGGTGYQNRTKSYTVASDDSKFYDYINELTKMSLEDREAKSAEFKQLEEDFANGLIDEEEYEAKKAPTFYAYITDFNVGSSGGDIVIPRLFTRNSLFYCYITSVQVDAVADWTGIKSITIPNTIETVTADSFNGAPEGFVFNIQHDSAVPTGWDSEWLPEGAVLNYAYDYENKVKKSDAEATQSGSEVIFGDDNKNYILGYYPTSGEQLPLVAEYELEGQPGTKLYHEFSLKSTSARYDSVGAKIYGRSNALPCDIPLSQGQKVNPDSIVIRNIYPATKNAANEYIPDTANSNGLYTKPLVAFSNSYNISDFISYDFNQISSFAGFTALSINVDINSDAKIYSKLNANYYKNNLANIESGATTIRYRLTSLTQCEFNITYKDGNTEKEVRLPIETPVSYYNFSSLKNNNIVFLINTSNVKEITPNNIVKFEFINLYITVDLFINETNSIVARSNVTTRFGNVVFLNDSNLPAKIFDVDLFLIIFAIAYTVIYAGAAVGYYFFSKNKYKNDEFRRMNTKRYIKNASLGFGGLGVVLFAILFIILRWSVLNNTVVVFNPADPFVVGFGIVGFLVLGYFIKFVVTSIKAEKQRRLSIKLNLDKDVDDDGTK